MSNRPNIHPTLTRLIAPITALAFLAFGVAGCAVDDGGEQEDGTDEQDEREETAEVSESLSTGGCSAWNIEPRASQKACISKVDSNTVRASASVTMKNRPSSCSVKVEVRRRTILPSSPIASRTFSCPSNGTTWSYAFSANVTRSGTYSTRVKVINATSSWTDSPGLSMSP